MILKANSNSDVICWRIKGRCSSFSIYTWSLHGERDMIWFWWGMPAIGCSSVWSSNYDRSYTWRGNI